MSASMHLRRTLAAALFTLGLSPTTSALAWEGSDREPRQPVGDLDLDLDRAADCLDFGTLAVCGDWVEDAEGAWVLDGDARIPTAAGDMALASASLTASVDPPALAGEARLAFPSLGFLDAAGFDGDAPWGRIALGDGDVIDTIEINGLEMPAEPGHQYLVVDYDQGFGIGFGAFSMSGGGGAGTLVIDPLDPLIYVGGDVAGFMGQGQISDAALGFSLGGHLPFETSQPLCKKNGNKCQPASLSGNLLAAGQVQVGRYPVWITSDMIIDIDASNDGETIFDGDIGDMKFGANGDLEIGYALGPVDLLIPVAEASVIYNGSVGKHGRLRLRGQAGAEGLFSGTPLEILEPDRPELDIKGWFDAPDDFSLRMAYSGSFFGLDADDVELVFSDAEVAAKATIRPAYVDLFGDAAVLVSGQIGFDGTYAFSGTANLSIAGFQLANAHCTWTNAGLRISGVMRLPAVGEVAVSASVDHTGHVTFDGDASLALLGFEIGDARLALDGDRLTITGDLGLMGLGSVAVSGRLDSDGDFRFTGEGVLSPLGFDLAGVAVDFRPGGLEVEGRIDLAGLATGGISGRVWTAESSQLPGGEYYQCQLFQQMVATLNAGQQFPCAPPAPGFRLTGYMDVGWGGVTLADARVVVYDGGATIRAGARFAGVDFGVSGRVTAAGRVDLTGTADIGWSGGIPGANASLSGHAELTMGRYTSGTPYASATVDVRACAEVWPIKTCAGTGGSVSSDGRVCLDFPIVGEQCLDLSGIL